MAEGKKIFELDVIRNWIKTLNKKTKTALVNVKYMVNALTMIPTMTNEMSAKDDRFIDKFKNKTKYRSLHVFIKFINFYFVSF